MRVGHRVGRDVAEVDEHAQPVHLAHDLLAERRQPVRASARRSPNRPRARSCCGSASCSPRRGVHHAQRRERRVDRVSALHADHRRDLARLEARSTSSAVRASASRPDTSRPCVDDVDLLERRASPPLSPAGGRDVDRPELPADAARRAAARCRSSTTAAAAGCRASEVAAAASFAHRPRVVVVAVDDGARRAAPQHGRSGSERTARSAPVTAAATRRSRRVHARRKVMGTFGRGATRSSIVTDQTCHHVRSLPVPPPRSRPALAGRCRASAAQTLSIPPALSVPRSTRLAAESARE